MATKKPVKKAAKKQTITSLANVSDDAVRAATGKGWSEWISYLDKHKAVDLTHKEQVALIARQTESSWWCQKISSAYELFKGKRTTGKTVDTGFQIGVRKTVPAPIDKVWELIASEEGTDLWLGKTKDKAKEKNSYVTKSGIRGEINVLKERSHIRLTWQPKGWEKASMLQIRVVANGPKTTVSFHHEGLPDEHAREEMKEQWTRIIGELAALL